jgi:hypothetical protein
LVDESLASLRQLPALQKLEIVGKRLSASGLNRLSGLQNLEELTITSVRTPLEEPVSWSRLPRLQRILLRDTYLGMLRLNSLPSLQRFGTSAHRAVTNVELVDCPEFLGSLSSRNRFGGTQLTAKNSVTDALLPNLEYVRTLKTLILAGEDVSDVGMTHIRHLSDLESLSLASTPVSDKTVDLLIDRFKTTRQLKEVDFSNTQVSGEGIKRLRNAMPDCKIRYESSRDD